MSTISVQDSVVITEGLDNSKSRITHVSGALKRANLSDTKKKEFSALLLDAQNCHSEAERFADIGNYEKAMHSLMESAFASGTLLGFVRAVER